jgi:hypothetical protein
MKRKVIPLYPHKYAPPPPPTYDIFDVHHLELERVNMIREASMDVLNNPSKMEVSLLPQLGLNNEVIEEFPESLSEYFGQGLQFWQYPNQFSKYLCKISEYNINSYLEIGVRHGGTFIITVEYLNRFNKINKAIGIDIADNVSLDDYKEKYNNSIEFYKIGSNTSIFKNYIKESSGFDLALIDGDHTYWGVRGDFEALQDHVNMFVFHDISNFACPDVNDFWTELKYSYKYQYNFYEFTDQYKSIYDTGRYYLGLGLMVDKGFEFNNKKRNQ